MEGIKITPYTAQKFSGPRNIKSEIIELNDTKTLPTTIYFEMLRRNLSDRSHPNASILPLDCRYFYKQPYTGNSLYVIEQKPSFRTIFSTVKMEKIINRLDREGKLKEWGYEDIYDRDKPYQFMLAFPFIIYFIVLNSHDQYSYMKVYCRTRPIQSHIDFICKIPLSNIDTSQSVCLGDYRNPRGNPMVSVENIIKMFWQNSFNDDYLYNPQDYAADKYVCDFITWEHMSKQDPMFIYKVDWIKWKRTFGQEIQNIINSLNDGHSGENPRKVVSWESMIAAFQKHIESEEIDEETDSEIIYNMTDSLMMEDGTIIYQGDSFVSNGNRFFVETICGPAETMEPNMVMLRKSDGTSVRYKLNSKSMKYLQDKVIEQRFITRFNFNGVEICRDDIVDVELEHLGKVKRKVKYFRYAIDGKLEMKTNNAFIMMDKVKNIQPINVDEVVIDGKKLEVGKEYVLGTSPTHGMSYSYSSSPFIMGNRGVYEGIDIRNERSSDLVITFRKPNGDVLSYNYDNVENTIKIIDEDHLVPLPKLFRVYNQVVYYPHIGNQYKCYDMDGYILMMDDYHGSDIGNLSFEKEFIEKLIVDNTFVLRSPDHDIMFSIGDQVVVSDWIDPAEMLKIKTIIGFSTDIETFTFSFVLEDKHGNITKKEFIKYNDREGTMLVNFNEIRPIKTEHEGVTSGTKIKSTEIGISNFPKKDTNIIIGFITDTKIPLVLCSNGCTLWFDDMMRNFELIERDNSRWNRLTHAPLNISKIKPQDGDLMVVNTNTPFLICKNTLYRSYETGIFLNSMTLPNAHGRTCQFDNYYKSVSNFVGILSPRYRKVDLETLPSNTGIFPKFTGEYINQNLSRFRFRHDPRRVVNVQ